MQCCTMVNTDTQHSRSVGYVLSHFPEVNYYIFHQSHNCVFEPGKLIQVAAITASDDISTLQCNTLTFKLVI